jgi:hypothetical protein
MHSSHAKRPLVPDGGIGLSTTVRASGPSVTSVCIPVRLRTGVWYAIWNNWGSSRVGRAVLAGQASRLAQARSLLALDVPASELAYQLQDGDVGGARRRNKSPGRSTIRHAQVTNPANGERICVNGWRSEAPPSDSAVSAVWRLAAIFCHGRRLLPCPRSRRATSYLRHQGREHRRDRRESS